MDGFLNTGLTFTDIILIIWSLVLGVVVIRVSLSFDINKYLDSRKNSFLAKAKNACPHFEFVPHEEGIKVRSFFVSPSGTPSYVCERCGTVRMQMDNDDFERQVEYYIANQKEYRKRIKNFVKYLRKSGRG